MSSMPNAAVSAPGFVTVAGAGPGDPELLTVKALRRIETAQAIVCDALISEGIRALFPRDCRLFDMGKRAGEAASAHQGEINRLLLELAREGLRVLRLKGGDPFIFGRGGEEALFLAAHQIPYEIIPAVSSVNGAAASVGIPLTHRGLSRSCAILQGYQPQGAGINWSALVAQGGTWVFLMAKEGVRAIARNLLNYGADPGLFLALVENATLPSQTVGIATLADAAEGGCTPRTNGPGIVLVGPTVECALELSSLLTGLPNDGATLSDFPEVGREKSLDCGWR